MLCSLVLVLNVLTCPDANFLFLSMCDMYLIGGAVMLVPLSQALTGWRMWRRRPIFRFLFDLHQLMSSSVSYDVLINTIWWSWMFPGRFPFRPQAVVKQVCYVKVDKSFQDWCRGVFKASLSRRRAPTVWCTSTSMWAKLICVTWD